MLEIDKLCYTSRLRYVNAGEKCFFSLASVILCIVSRSIPAALLLLLASTYLTVQRGGISLGRWLKYLTLPLFFLLLSTGAILINISQVPLDAFALPVGSLYLTGSREGVFQAVQLILTALACMSALDRYPGRAGVLPPAPPSNRAYYAHLPVHFPPSGKRLLHASFPERQAWK